MALGIDVSSNEPETNGNNLPSGRSNLKGQQKPEYLLWALEAEKKARSEYGKAVDDYEDNPSELVRITMWQFLTVWNAASRELTFAQTRWSMEQKHGMPA